MGHAVDTKPGEMTAELQWNARLGGRSVPKSSMSRGGQEVVREKEQGGLSLRAEAPKGCQGMANGPGPSWAAPHSAAAGLHEAFPALSPLGNTNCHIRESPEHNTHHFLIS